MSEKQWIHLKDNYLLVSGYSENKNANNIINVTYENVKYDKHIDMRNRTGNSHGKRRKWKTFLLDSIKGNCMLIVAKRNELDIKNLNLLFIDGSGQVPLEENETKAYKPSGIVVLFMCKLCLDKYTTEYTWGQKEANILKSCKNNIITGHSHHFGSTGNHYSYGNRAIYGIINKSSVTQYVSRKYSKKESTLKAARNAKMIEDRASEAMKNGIMALTTITPNLKEYIAPTLNVIYDI